MSKMLILTKGIGRAVATVVAVLLAAGSVRAQNGNLRYEPVPQAAGTEWGGQSPMMESVVDSPLPGDVTADNPLPGTAPPMEVDAASLPQDDSPSTAVACDDEGPCPGYKTWCKGCEKCATAPYGVLNRLIDKKLSLIHI